MKLSDLTYKIDWTKAFIKDLAMENELLETMSQQKFEKGGTVSIKRCRARSPQE